MRNRIAGHGESAKIGTCHEGLKRLQAGRPMGVCASVDGSERILWQLFWFFGEGPFRRAPNRVKCDSLVIRRLVFVTTSG
jgi:hypothetical protein